MGQTTTSPMITARDLRAILFEIDNQDLTVRELHQRLFQVEDQSKPLDVRAVRFFAF